MPGPAIRTDIVEVYVFRRAKDAGARVGARVGARGLEILQLRRSGGVLPGTWQPVMGHVREGERAAEAAWRELGEETGLAPPLPASPEGEEALRGAVLGMWQLEKPSVYFLHEAEAMVMSPGFAVEVQAGAEPELNGEHDGHRWVSRAEVDRAFLWPGQREAARQIVRDIVEAGSPVEPVLRVNWRVFAR